MGHRERSTAEYLAMVGRMITAAGRRVADGDIEDLPTLIALRRELDDAVAAAVDGLRMSGASWRAIGLVTGTSHVAAIQKWSPYVTAMEWQRRQPPGVEKAT